jgi:hypothetical protein
MNIYNNQRVICNEAHNTKREEQIRWHDMVSEIPFTVLKRRAADMCGLAPCISNGMLEKET